MSSRILAAVLRRLVPAVALGLVAGPAAALKFDPYTFTGPDGEPCEVRQIVFVGENRKEVSGFPVGTRFAVATGSCTTRTGSRVLRSAIYTYPPVSEPIRSETLLEPNGREPVRADAATAEAIVATRFLIDPWVVGLAEIDNPAFFNPFQAFRREVGGSRAFQPLGSLAGRNGTSAAYGGAIDGSVIVGTSTLLDALNPDPVRAFRWTPALGMQDLGAPFPGASSDARAASADGSVVVGGAFFALGVQQAFRWTLSNAATGAGSMTSLGAATKIALAVSADGSVVVGKGANDRAFRWTAAGGVTDLGTLPGLAQAQATGVSDDGRVVVGNAGALMVVNFPRPLEPAAGDRAFRWTAATGTQYLGDLLAAAGVDMTGVTLLSADAVSDDGTFISGTARIAGSTDPVGYAVRYRDATVGASPPTASVVSLAFASAPGASLSASAGAGSVAGGQSASTTLTLAYSGGFSGTVIFDCENLPAGVACSFSPATRSTPGSTVLTISTRSAASTALGTLLLGGLALPLLSGRRRFAVVLAALVAAGCGGGGGGGDAGGGASATAQATPPGIYAIGVVARSGTDVVARTTYTLTVR